MFTVITSLIDLIAGIISGAFRLVCTFITTCFGLAIVALLVTGLVIVAAFHLL